jgi:23S rRNA (uracil1939-C5)-methyltransferase
MLKVGNQYHVGAFDQDYEARGVVKVDDGFVFVPYLLPLEQADIEITKIHKTHAEGKIVKRYSTNPHRVYHPDEGLGGCDCIHMDLILQKQWVEKITSRTLLKGAAIDFPLLDVVTDQKMTHYRNKSVFHVISSTPLTFGVYQKEPVCLVKKDEFILSDHLCNEIIQYITKKNIMVEKNNIKHLVIRTNPWKEALVTFVVEKTDFQGKTELIESLSKLKSVIGITLNMKSKRLEILSDKSVTVYGVNMLKMPLSKGYVWIDDRSFFQVNLPVALDVYHIISKYIHPSDHVIDAYSGVGSIGFYLVDKAKEIIMIESNYAAIQMAEKVKNDLNYHTVKIIYERAEIEIEKHDAQVLIVDPPKNGLMPNLLNHLLIKPFDTFIYLSCDIKTLSRDLRVLKNVYDVKAIYPIRMFPNTSELETLVIMKKAIS